MKKTHILYALEAAGGGSLKHLVYLVTRLNPSRFCITIVLSKSRKEDIRNELNDLKKAGAAIRFIPMNRSIRPLWDIFLIFRIICLLFRMKPDIVHSHSSKAGALFRIAGWLCKVNKIYHTPHCFYFQGKTGILRKLYLLVEKILSKITTGIVVSSNEQHEALVNKLTSPKKFININNAIDFDDYQQLKNITSIKSNLNIPLDSFVVGAIGRLAMQKDWRTYVYAANEVLKTYPNTIFLIVGEGKCRSEITNLIKNLKLDKNLRLIGYKKDIQEIFSIIDILVNTSRWEGLPYVFLEAMKYAKPIIATDTGNATDIIHNKTGYITPVKDYKAIAGNIALLIENKNLCRDMGERGNDRLIQKYSFEYFISRHEKLYLS